MHFDLNDDEDDAAGGSGGEDDAGAAPEALQAGPAVTVASEGAGASADEGGSSEEEPEVIDVDDEGAGDETAHSEANDAGPSAPAPAPVEAAEADAAIGGPETNYEKCGINGCILQDNHSGMCVFEFATGPRKRQATSFTVPPPIKAPRAKPKP